ncbi:MAG: biopolymer transporter ExbD [Myxococcales bacterium]|nr:biopolymer transporter ExbD [Myxococcales bacterium]
MENLRLQAKRKARQLKRAMPEEDSISHLNITPMMDMMTILLIFFLKNFSVSEANLTLSNDLIIPRSSTETNTHKAVQITVTKKAIVVESGDSAEPIAAVKNGEVDASVKRDGQSGYVITPLMSLLQKHATRLKLIEKRTRGRMKFEGEIVVVADHTTPYRLISEVLYTAGQAEFGKYRLMVLKGGKAITSGPAAKK